MIAGYVYVAALSNGMVKVGRSQDAGRRLGEHKRNARTLGLTVTDSWISPIHAEWHANEDALKEIALGLGGTPEGREAFSGIAFADMVSKAGELVFTAPQDAALEEPSEPAVRQSPAQPPASPDGPPARALEPDLDLGAWVVCPGILASPAGRTRLEKIRILVDAAAADPMGQVLLHDHIADEFMALVRETLREAVVFRQGVEEARAIRAEWEKEQARKATA